MLISFLIFQYLIPDLTLTALQPPVLSVRFLLLGLSRLEQFLRFPAWVFLQSHTKLDFNLIFF